ncbi:MAG: hypothetical protein OEV35_03095 [Gallionellaceae bacterium]|nr:hypothetical protein [Gallionellaceae bacterium]
MKLNHTLLTLITAALLPTAAYASTDKISASQESSSTCSSTITMESAVPRDYPFMVELEHLEEGEINTLASNTDDPILASYYLDFYHWPDPVRTMQFSNAPDPYLDAVTLALFGPTEMKSRYVC